MGKGTKRIRLFGVCCMMVVLAGCQKSGETPKVTTENTEMETAVTKMGGTNDGNLLREYYALLLTTTEKEDLYIFIEEHIQEAEPKDADQLINGLIGYLADADAVDYNRLEKQKAYLTQEMQDFVGLMQQEQTKPALADMRVEISLGELLLRAKQFEEHARKYPAGVTFSYAYEKYCELLYAAITGFYDGSDDWSNCYLDTDQVHIEEAALTAYTEFIAAYPESHTADVLREYVDLLSENDRVFSKTVKNFYERLDVVIKEHFSVQI